jgi:hypothetical protein
MVIISKFEAPRPNSWLAGFGRERSVRKSGERETLDFELWDRVEIVRAVVVSTLKMLQPE